LTGVSTAEFGFLNRGRPRSDRRVDPRRPGWYDAATLSAVATILTLVGAVASLMPAYRATKIDPLMALRDDR
jgi:hypothetical protein